MARHASMVAVGKRPDARTWVLALAWFFFKGSLAAMPCTMTAEIVSDPPTPAVVCVGDMITVSAVVTGGTAPFTYSWSNGETSESFTVPAPFSQTLVLNVTDAEGCTALAILHIKIDVLDFYIGYDMTPACAGDVITLVIATTVTLPGLEYMWSTGETTSTIEVSTSGTYAATLSHPSLPCEAVHEVEIIIHPEPGPEPEIIGPAMLCEGQTAVLSVAGGPFSGYNWSTGDNTPTTEIIGPGFITVWVENEVGCVGTDDIEILPFSVEAMLNDPEPICPGQTTILEVLNAGDFDMFEWNTGETTPSITVTTPGFYSVTASAGDCTSIVTVEVPASGVMFDLTAIQTAVTSCTSPNGAIDLTVSPPGGYSYLWSGGQSTEDLANVMAGIYTVTVTDPDGCSTSGTFEVEDNTIPPGSSAIATPSTCQQMNGAIDLTVSPPGSYSFIWSNGMTSEDISNVSAGTYSVTITSVATGCTSVASFTVDNIDPPITVNGMASPVTSCSSPNGSIDITPDPAGNYTFLWSSGQTTEDLQDIPAGTYTVTVYGGGSCTGTATFTVDNATTAPTLSFGILAATCGMANGSVDLTTSPAGAYTFLWSTGESTEDLAGIPAGIYEVTVTAPDGCMASGIADVPDETFDPVLSGVVTPNTSCSGSNGAIDLSIDPQESYTYTWSSGESTEDLTGLSAGTYSVTVSIGIGCQSDTTFVVEDMTDTLSYSAIVMANGSCASPDGLIDLTVTSPGTVSFLWSNGETTEDIGQLGGGTYSVTLTDDQGCITIASFFVPNTQSTFTVADSIIANTSCILANGSIDVTVMPSAAYLFVWSNGEMTEDIHDVGSGVYTLTVTDAGPCSQVLQYTIPDSLQYPQLSGQVDTAGCSSANGAIHLLVEPALGNSYLWSTGAMSQDLTGVPAGNYAVTVTSSAGCMATDTFQVPFLPPQFSISGTVGPASSCLAPDGAIDLTIDPPGFYTFLWSGGQATEDLNGLAAGEYQVTVTDGTGCQLADTFQVTSVQVLPSLTASVSAAICTSMNGGVDISVAPAGTYQFAWSTGAVTEDIGGLGPGQYSVTVTDMNGCAVQDTFQVGQEVNVYALDAVVAADTSCLVSTGSIDLSVIPTGSFSFSWSNGLMTEDQVGLEAGDFSVTVIDAFGCEASAVFTIDDDTVIPMLGGTAMATRCGQADGSIDLVVSPASTYGFLWSTGALTEDLTGLDAGQYGVTVTGPGQCTADTTFTVDDTGVAIQLTGSVSDNTTCTGVNGAIDLDVSPIGTYMFLWSHGFVAEDPGGLSSGDYSVTVTDLSGCSSSASFVIVDNAPLPLLEGISTPALCGLPMGEIDLTVTPPDGNMFNWSTGATSEDLADLQPGMYQVTVTASNGCTGTAQFDVPGSEPPGITLAASGSPAGEDMVLLQATLDGPWSILDTLIWLPEALFTCGDPLCTEQLIVVPAEPTLVRVIAIDTNGCLSEAQLLLRRETDPFVQVPNVFTPNGDGVNDWFTVYGNKDVELVIELQVFDRWGNFVFRNSNFPPNLETLGWDGRFRGLDMDPAVFAFWARVRFVDGTEKAFKGDVTLLR